MADILKNKKIIPQDPQFEQNESWGLDLLKTPGRFAAGALGSYGDMENLLQGLSTLVPGRQELAQTEFAKEIPFSERMQKAEEKYPIPKKLRFFEEDDALEETEVMRDLLGKVARGKSLLPSSGDILNFFSEKFGEMEPKTIPGRILGGAAEYAGSAAAMSPAKILAPLSKSKLLKAVAPIGKSLISGTLGKGAREVGEAADWPEWAKGLADLGFTVGSQIFLASPTANIKKMIPEFFKDIEEDLPKQPDILFKKAIPNYDKYVKWARAGSGEGKENKELINRLQGLRMKEFGGKLTPFDLYAEEKSLNQLYPLKGKLLELKNEISSTLKEQTPKEFSNKYTAAKSMYHGLKEAEKAAKIVKKAAGGLGGLSIATQMLYGLGHAKPMGIPQAVAQAGVYGTASYFGSKIAEGGVGMFKSPQLRNYYLKSLVAAAKEDVPLLSKYVKKVDQLMPKEKALQLQDLTSTGLVRGRLNQQPTQEQTPSDLNDIERPVFMRGRLK